MASQPLPNCEQCPFRHHLAQFAGAGHPDDVIALRQGARAMPKKTTLYREGEGWDTLYVLSSGWAFSFRMTSENRRQIFDFYLPGDAINLSSLRLDRASTTVQALTDVVLCLFARSEMDAFMHGDISRTHQLERYWIEALWTVKDSVMDLGRRTSMQRIARFIVNLERRLRERGLSQDGALEFPLRYQHIADALGLTPVHVNRIISALREGGVIELRNRILAIRRPEELAALAK